MIRIYLDWNVISNLKRSDFFGIQEFIQLHKEKFLFPYTSAHFSDLMKSNTPNNPHFQTDLETLQSLSGKHLITWENGQAFPRFGTPEEYFENYDDGVDVRSLLDMDNCFDYFNEIGKEIGMEGIGELFKGLFNMVPSNIDINDKNREHINMLFPNLTSSSTQWDVMKESGNMMGRLMDDRSYYKNLRKSMSDQGFRLDKNSGNWKEDEVMENIDAFLKSSGLDMDFLGFMDYIFKLRNEQPDGITYFSTCYSMLDMLGYKADKLPKPTDSAMNIYTDAQHAYYAGHCDFFVVGDGNLAKKAKTLYKKFNLSTKVLDPSEMVTEIGKAILPSVGDHQTFLNVALEIVKTGYDHLEYPELNQEGGVAYSCRLPVFYFDFFNHAMVHQIPQENILLITFYKRSRNLSRFFYYTEFEKVIWSIAAFFGWTKELNFEDLQKDILNDKEINLRAEYEFGFVEINYEDYKDLKRPSLVYGISMK